VDPVWESDLTIWCTYEFIDYNVSITHKQPGGGGGGGSENGTNIERNFVKQSFAEKNSI